MSTRSADPQGFARLRQEAFRAYEAGDPKALGLMRSLLPLAPKDGGLLIAEAILAQEMDDPRALDRLHRLLRTAPDWLDGHVTLAQLLWGRGERESFLAPMEAALQVLPRHAGLWMRYMQLLADSGMPGRAADAARRLRQEGSPDALRLIEARYAGHAGEHDRAIALLRSLPARMPEAARETARHFLRIGDPAPALSLLNQARDEAPRDVGVWALTELAWRCVGDPRHDWLLDAEAMIATRRVELDEDDLAQVVDSLRLVHRRRWPAIGQSLRGGTQTRGHLANRWEPEIGNLFETLKQAVADHIVSRPRRSADHPLLPSRAHPPRIVSAWSIRLEPGGHHVSHVHPGGMLSSVLHLSVPQTGGQEGLLELGRPPADCAALHLSPLATVTPQPGHLTLFPSFLYHGTTSFKGGERLSVAFDATF